MWRRHTLLGLVNDLYVWMSFSLCLPHDLSVSALCILMVLYVFVYLIRSANVFFEWSLKHRILGKRSVARILLFICWLSDLEYSAWSWVKIVL